MKKTGILFLISGPSGVGKKTVLTDLFKIPELNLHFSISMTTRKKRKEEIEGIDYFFVTKKFFRSEIKKNNMLEYAEFFNNYYGTPKSVVAKMLAEGKNVLLEIEVIGAQQIINLIPDCISIFIYPPSLEELEKRLILRNTEDLATIKMRVKKAAVEMKFVNIYKYSVLNDDVIKANHEIYEIIKSEINKHQK